MHNSMLQFKVRAGVPLTGTTQVPGDKSISHRAVMLGSLAQGTSYVRGWLAAGDTEATLGAFRALGVQIERPDTHTLTIHGGELQQPEAPLDFVNAGTGIRLAVGIMAGQPFPSVLDGSEQLRRRPMKRVVLPLAQMGADITATNDRAPLHVKPAKLRGVRYDMPVASGQVKSCILLAGLFADGVTAVSESGPARDHTEIMLKAMGADIHVENGTSVLKPGRELQPINITVPGDISSAAFLMVAASIVPGSDLTIQHVNLNPTRTGLLDVLLAMGADITVTETGSEAGEPVGDIRVRYAQLKGVSVSGDDVVRMIDEFPAMMVAALCAEGTSVVSNAEELRVKETDRLAVMTAELSKLGAVITETPDGFEIAGPQKLVGAAVESHDDHRIAMSMTVAGLVASGETIVNDARCAGDSFPGFSEIVQAIGAQLDVVEQ